MPLTLAAVAAVPQVLKGINGIFKNAKGKKLAKNNPFVEEGVNQNIVQNAAIANQMAQVGTPQAQYNNQQQAIDRNQAGALRLLGNGNMPNSSLQSTLRASNDATGNLNVQDAVNRQQNQRFAIGQNGILANEQNRVWDWNKRQRYLQNGRAAAELMRSGSQDMSQSLDNISSIGQMAMSGDNRDSTPNTLSTTTGQNMLNNGKTFNTNFMGGLFNKSYQPQGGASGQMKGMKLVNGQIVYQ